jgi:hypothetical protein
MANELGGRPILIVYGEIDLFVVELQDAFDRAGADTLIARTPADAMRHLKRFDRDAGSAVPCSWTHPTTL